MLTNLPHLEVIRHPVVVDIQLHERIRHTSVSRLRVACEIAIDCPIKDSYEGTFEGIDISIFIQAKNTFVTFNKCYGRNSYYYYLRRFSATSYDLTRPKLPKFRPRLILYFLPLLKTYFSAVFGFFCCPGAGLVILESIIPAYILKRATR